MEEAAAVSAIVGQREMIGREPPVDDCVVYRFANCRFDCAIRDLRIGRRTVRLRPQLATLLQLFLENRHRVITRDEIKRALWGGQLVVDFDAAITTCIKELRQELSDGTHRPRFIETIPRAGYRFVCDATDGAEGQSSAPRRSWRPQIVLGALVLFIALFMARAYWPLGRNEASGEILVAILPFDTFDAGDRSSVLQTTLLDDLITEIGPVAPEQLSVVARTSILSARASSEDWRALLHRLKVDYVLDGSMRRLEDRWIVVVNLEEVANGRYRWGGVFDITSGNPDFTSDVAHRISASLLPVLLPHQLGRAVQVKTREDPNDRRP